jgi:peptide/nickel transport system substrate-binding protein
MKKSLLIVAMVTLLTALPFVAGTPPLEAKTLRWAFSGDVYSMDPHAHTVSFTNAFHYHIYETLARYNKDLKIEPALATSWKIIEPTVWRFTLRRGVKFHNGNPLTADDVVASLTRALGSPLRANITQVKDCRKVDDYTVDVILYGPHPIVLNGLTNICIMDKEWMTENKCLDPVDPAKGQDSYASTHAIGTGPFMLESRQPDARTVLAVNPNWWDKPEHNLDHIVFTPIKSDATRVAALLSGELDFMHPAPLQDLDRISRTPGMKLLEAPDLRTIMLSINQAPAEPFESNIKGKNPLKDIRVRKALYQAIDVESIKTRIMRGKSRIAGLFVAPEIPGFDPALNGRLLPYDPDAAKKLLVEAGYPDGFEIGFDAPNDRYVNDEKIAQAIVPMWARIGVKAKLTTQPGSAHFNKALGGKSDIWMFGWATLPMLDSYSVLSQILSSSREKLGSNNPGGYKNPKVDELVDKVAVELDEPKRLKMISETFRLAKEDCVLITLHQQPMAWAVRDNVKIVQTADDLPRLWYARID